MEKRSLTVASSAGYSKGDGDDDHEAKLAKTSHHDTEGSDDDDRQQLSALDGIAIERMQDAEDLLPVAEENPCSESPEGVTFLGADADRALGLIPPPPASETGENPDVDMIRQIGRIYSQRSIRNRMTHEASRGKDPSVRYIQSSRFELFVRDASDKGSTFWDSVLQQNASVLPADCTDRLCVYAEAQARRDPRIGTKSFKFGNFSLIVSYGKVSAQAPHIDLLAPNYQFAILLTDGSPSTIMYDVRDRIRSVDDLRRLWQQVDEPFPASLAQALETSFDVKSMLTDFGDVLHSSAYFHSDQVEQKRECLPAGSVLSLPGGVTHAGPASNSFRAVLFFSAVPASNALVEYNPDVQFSSIIWTGDVLQDVWRRAGMNREGRLYLLRRLATYIRQANVRRRWDRHFPQEGNLGKIVRKMASNVDDKSLDEYLHEQAETEELFDYILSNEDSGRNPHEFECVSHPRLCTKWERKAYHLSVYMRKADGKVVLYYSPNNGRGIEELEGHMAGDRYSLSMQPGKTIFNGKNGILRDNDGDEIVCFCGKS